METCILFSPILIIFRQKVGLKTIKLLIKKLKMEWQCSEIIKSNLKINTTIISVVTFITNWWWKPQHMRPGSEKANHRRDSELSLQYVLVCGLSLSLSSSLLPTAGSKIKSSRGSIQNVMSSSFWWIWSHSFEGQTGTNSIVQGILCFLIGQLKWWPCANVFCIGLSYETTKRHIISVSEVKTKHYPVLVRYSILPPYHL